jgi:hypothetical protein
MGAVNVNGSVGAESLWVYDLASDGSVVDAFILLTISICTAPWKPTSSTVRLERQSAVFFPSNDQLNANTSHPPFLTVSAV